MALATRCPSCKALFRVGPEQLKSRGGMVRCGSCRHVFNAVGHLEYISPEGYDTESPLLTKPAPPVPRPVVAGPSAGADVAPAAQAGSVPSATPSAAPSAPPQIAPVPVAPVHRASLPFAPVAPAPVQPVPVPVGALGAAQRGPSTRPLEAPGGEGDAVLGAERLAGIPTGGLEDDIEDSQSSGATRISEARAFAISGPGPTSVDDSAPRTLYEALNSPLDLPDYADPEASFAEEPDGGEDSEPDFLRSNAPRASPAQRIALSISCALLLPLLVLQLALLTRTNLVVHLPQLQPLLAALCEPLGCTASWPMRPDLLAMVSSELQATPGTDALELDAVVRNRAGFAVAVPAIELTLTDSENRVVARRVFLPREFAPQHTDAAASGPFLDAGADLSLRLLFELPAGNAAGFVAYPFYP